MKNNRSITFIPLLIIMAIMAIGMVFATGAFAWQSGADAFPTYGSSGTTVYYSTNFAPDSVTVVNLGTQGGYYNFTVDQTATYQFMLVKLSDDTAVTCSARFGGYSSVYGTTTTGAFATSGVGPWHPGNGVKRMGVFGCPSSSVAAAPVLKLFKQKKAVK